MGSQGNHSIQKINQEFYKPEMVHLRKDKLKIQ